MKKDRVSVIGLGYVGLTLAAVLAEKGFEVFGVDINKSLIRKLKKCEPHFYEKGLTSILRNHVGKNLFFQEKIPEKQEIFILSVGTPLNEETKKPNLEYIINSTQQTTKCINNGNLIVLRSTVPIGTTRKIIKPILDKTGKNYSLAFCPERTIEGKAVEELKELPQIIGGINEKSVDLAFDLFNKITSTTIKMSSIESAEMVKLLCNSYRDITFAYANEVALICEKVGLDPAEIINASNKGYDRSKIPLPGFVGGSCLEKDPYILADCINRTDYVPKIITKGRKINEQIIRYAVDKIKHIVGPLEKTFISGLAFKGRPETNDLRGSSSVKLIEYLRRENYKNLFVHDFVVDPNELKKQGYVPVNLDQGFQNAKCVLIGNNNEKYGFLDIDNYLKLMDKNSLFFDIWNQFNSRKVEAHGIIYAGIGK